MDPPTKWGGPWKKWGVLKKIFWLASLAELDPPTFKTVAPPLGGGEYAKYVDVNN